MANNYYEALGTTENASQDDIKQAFRKLAKKFHPDRNPGNKRAETKFKELSEAYDTLSDPQKRAQYDQQLKYGAFTGGGPGSTGGPGMGGFGQGFGGGGGGFDFNQFVNRRSGSSRGGSQGFSSSGGNSFDINEILAAMMGGSSAGQGRSTDFSGFGQQQQQASIPDVETEVAISFREALSGTSRQLQLSNGKKLNVKIPPGINNGGKIRLSGQGQSVLYGGKAGDIIVKVSVMPDQKFERKGNDIYSKVEITFKDAILGTKATIDTLTKKIKLTIPAGTQPGTVMRLKGQGFAGGDQYVEIKVTIPTDLTDKQREIIEGWE